MIDRREVITGIAAGAIVTAMPTAAVAAVETVDPTIERMKALLHQLFDLLRSDGYAIAKLNDGGRVMFWLHDRADITSMQLMSLDDEATPDVVALLERAVSIEPTLVRM